jgi:hypothetical protein
MWRWQPMASMETIAPLDHQHAEERRNSDDLVGFFRHFDLPEHSRSC